MNSKYRLIDINLKQASHFIILSEDHISKITGTNAIKRRNYVDDIKYIAKLSLNTKWMAYLTIKNFHLGKLLILITLIINKTWTTAYD